VSHAIVYTTTCRVACQSGGRRDHCRRGVDAVQQPDAPPALQRRRVCSSRDASCACCWCCCRCYRCCLLYFGASCLQGQWIPAAAAAAAAAALSAGLAAGLPPELHGLAVLQQPRLWGSALRAKTGQEWRSSCGCAACGAVRRHLQRRQRRRPVAACIRCAGLRIGAFVARMACKSSLLHVNDCREEATEESRTTAPAASTGGTELPCSRVVCLSQKNVAPGCWYVLQQTHPSGQPQNSKRLAVPEPAAAAPAR
jgi:hypothetical protein